MKKACAGLVFVFGCGLALFAQDATPFHGGTIATPDKKGTGKEGSSSTTTPGSGPGVGASASESAANTFENFPDISLPVKTSQGMVVLKGADAWKHLSGKQPKLFAILQKLIVAARRLKGESEVVRFFAGLRGVHLHDGFAVLELSGNRHLVLDGGKFDRMVSFSYDRLTADERRILEKSRIEGAVGVDGKPLAGPALFAHLAATNPKALLAFTNLCARMRSPAYQFPVKGETRSALQFIGGLTYLECDRFRAECDPTLMTMVSLAKKFSSAPGHGEQFPTSFKQNDVKSGGGQFCFSPSATAVEFDIDMYNIAARNPFKKIVGAIGHAGEVLTPGKTDPYKIYNQLKGQDIQVSAVVSGFPEGLAGLD